ncbi:MAG: hypothetical protein K8R89_06410, partial [Anaerolineae bacterium]|nr:hypothetical protein [Anaerolineae bacterium]
MRYGNLSTMDDVNTYFEDGFMVATDRRFVIISTDNVVERPYTTVYRIGMKENHSIYHSSFIEFSDGLILSAEFCFPFNHLAGLAAYQASREG